MPCGTPGSLLKGALCASLFTLLALTGCGIGEIQTDSFIANPGLVISGHVHGGAFPIQQATITLMETQIQAGRNRTYTKPAVPASTYGFAAKSLTTATSNQYGYFTFTNYTGCDSGQYVYAVVTGGQTVSGKTNDNVVQVGVIGSCDTALANPNNVNIWISEPSTIAAAYALGNFISISPNDGSGKQVVNIGAPINNSSTGGCSGTGTGMTCTAAGLAHAFQNAINLVDSVRTDGNFPTGQANSTFVVTANSQAVVPQAMINTLGNILQSCVDSGGVTTSSSITATSSDGSDCGNLFEDAATPSGTVPMNTLQVALNFAAYPTNNVPVLFALQTSNVFFTPDMATDHFDGTNASTCAAATTTTPKGSTTPVTTPAVTTGCIPFTLSIFYNGTGLNDANGVTESIATPVDVALDAEDNAYVLYQNAAGTFGAIDGFSANGVGLFIGTHQLAITNPAGLAIDTLGDAWVTNDTSSGSLYALSTVAASGGNINQTISISNGYPAGVTVGLSNEVWVSRDAADAKQSLFRFVPPSSGTAYTSTTFNTAPSIQASVKRIQLDSAQNLFTVTDSTTATAKVVGMPYGSNGASATLESANLNATGGFSMAVGAATSPSGGGMAYFPIKGEVDTASGTTTTLGAGTGGSYTGITASVAPGGADIDGAGNLFWTDNETGGQVYMLTTTTGTGASSTTSLSGGSLISFSPCYIAASKCHTPANGTFLHGMAIDSSGAMWYVSNSGLYPVVQTLGLAAPTWPLTSYAQGATTVQ